MSPDARIEPTTTQLQLLTAAAQERGSAVVMVNLLKFNDQGGRDSYQTYASEVRPHLERVGARVLYAGDYAEVVIGSDNRPEWDAIVIVQYPSRAKFLEMIHHPEYQRVATHRGDALETSGLLATDPWPPYE
jgi:uncharacterized protein (DUF1330 family)